MLQAPQGAFGCSGKLGLARWLSGVVPGMPDSFQGSFFLESLQKPRENGCFLKITMVKKNGESTPRVVVGTAGCVFDSWYGAW